MKIVITGGLGFVGSHVTRFLLDNGHRVTAVGRRPDRQMFENERFRYISADTTRQGPWRKALDDTDAIINLAGQTIFKRWTKRYKRKIYDSRILTTRNLVDAMPVERKIVFLSTSATGYYGDGGESVLVEEAPNGDDFLARLSSDWEAEAVKARQKGARVITARLGIILGQDGGIMEKLLPVFKLYAGGPLGSGRQWFPWMHINDLTAACRFILENKTIQGPLNFCSPNPVRNIDFVKVLGRVLKRPAFMPVPAVVLRLFMGEFGTAILYSQRAIGQKLLDHGFLFRFPQIEDALNDIVEKRSKSNLSQSRKDTKEYKKD